MRSGVRRRAGGVDHGETPRVAGGEVLEGIPDPAVEGEVLDLDPVATALAAGDGPADPRVAERVATLEQQVTALQDQLTSGEGGDGLAVRGRQRRRAAQQRLGEGVERACGVRVAGEQTGDRGLTPPEPSQRHRHRRHQRDQRPVILRNCRAQQDAQV